jgi:hypothetical protein
VSNKITESAKSTVSRQGASCEMVLCENPKTGEIQLRPKGKCDRGFLEQARDKMSEAGFEFVLPPKVRTVEEPEK